MCVMNVTIPVLIQHFPMRLEGRLSWSIEVQLVSKLSAKFKSTDLLHLSVTHYSSKTHNMCARNVTIPVLIKYIFQCDNKVGFPVQ
jgi:hypothetical protein